MVFHYGQTVFEGLKAYRKKDNRIIFFRLEKNSGAGVARNNSIKEAKGRFLAFCDSDDWYDETFLSVLLERIEKDDSDIAFCGYKIVSQNNECKNRPLLSIKSILQTSFLY